MTSPVFTWSPLLDDRLLVDAGVLVRALVLDEVVDVDLGGRRRSLEAGTSARTTMRAASTESTTPSRLATTVTPESRATMPSMPGADRAARAVRMQRHRLALHVGAHERAVGVVVLEERDQRRGHRDQLVRRHVHEVDVLAACAMHERRRRGGGDEVRR